MRFITKQTTFIFSILFVTVPLAAIIIQETCDYQAGGWCRDNWSLIGIVGKTTILPAILFFVTSLITYPFKINVFESWKKFVIWSLPIVVVLTYIIINMDGGGSWGPSINMGIILLPLLYGLFFLTSLIIITVTAIRNR